MQAELHRDRPRSERARIAVVCSGRGTGRAMVKTLVDELVDVLAVIIERSRGPEEFDNEIDNDALLRTCDAAGIPVMVLDGAGDTHVASAMAELAPDLLVVIDGRRPVSPELLATIRLGGVGIHPSLLPDYPGPDAVNWAILRGEMTTGVTMFLLDAHGTRGRVVAQRVVRIGPNDTCAELYARTDEASAQLLVEQLPALLSGIAPPEALALDPRIPHLPLRTPDMGVVDWTSSGRMVHDWVRALTLPFSGAFSVLDERRVMIWATRLPAPREPVGPPGEVIGFDRGGVRIGVQAGSIIVSRMSYSGNPPAPAALWCRVTGVDVGARFELVPADHAARARGAGVQRRSVS